MEIKAHNRVQRTFVLYILYDFYCLMFSNKMIMTEEKKLKIIKEIKKRLNLAG